MLFRSSEIFGWVETSRALLAVAWIPKFRMAFVLLKYLIYSYTKLALKSKGWL